MQKDAIRMQAEKRGAALQALPDPGMTLERDREERLKRPERCRRLASLRSRGGASIAPGFQTPDGAARAPTYAEGRAWLSVGAGDRSRNMEMRP